MALHDEVVYVPWEIITDKRLSPEAKLVYSWVINEDEMPSLDDIAEGVGIETQQVATAFKELESQDLMPVPGTVRLDLLERALKQRGAQHLNGTKKEVNWQ